jgi:hypothetical protein
MHKMEENELQTFIQEKCWLSDEPTRLEAYSIFAEVERLGNDTIWPTIEVEIVDGSSHFEISFSVYLEGDVDKRNAEYERMITKARKLKELFAKVEELLPQIRNQADIYRSHIVKEEGDTSEEK